MAKLVNSAQFLINARQNVMNIIDFYASTVPPVIDGCGSWNMSIKCTLGQTSVPAHSLTLIMATDLSHQDIDLSLA